MIKIPTLFKKNPENLGRVINEINPGCEWVLDDVDNVKPTRKFDGTAAAVINGNLYKRYDVKKGREVPAGAIPCQEPDPITGHWPHWVAVDFGLHTEDKYFVEGFKNSAAGIDMPDGTYELCGPKVQGNKEKVDKHVLIPHGLRIGYLTSGNLFEDLKRFLEFHDVEGIVFHHADGRMCKIRKSDFGIKR